MSATGAGRRRRGDTAIFDSTIWNDFQFRDDDIIISICEVGDLDAADHHAASGGSELVEISPWLTSACRQRGKRRWSRRRHTGDSSTHLPVDALVFSPRQVHLHRADSRDVSGASTITT
jgi:aryl sulfotransferase